MTKITVDFRNFATVSKSHPLIYSARRGRNVCKIFHS